MTNNNDQVIFCLSSEWLKLFSELPKSLQDKISSLLLKLMNDPETLEGQLEKIPGALDQKMRRLRLDHNYSGIVVRYEKSEIYLLLFIHGHDQALQWALNRKCEINAKTGSLQVFVSHPELWYVEALPAGYLADRPSPSGPAHLGQAGILDQVSDKDLLALGLPKELLPLVRSLKSPEELLRAGPELPVDSFEILEYLAYGCSIEDIKEVFGELFHIHDQNKENFNPNDLALSLKNDLNLANFVVIGGNEELLRILDEPLEKWRVFLHPHQRKLVSKTFKGPYMVLGGAGTGKTVVAMHRAKWLASRCQGHEKILLTTFTRNLAGDLKHNLSKICSPEEMKRVEVCNFDHWVNKYMNQHQYEFQIVYGPDLKKLWLKAIDLAKPLVQFDRTFYEQEWNQVVTVQETFSLAQYLAASRLGRGTRLDRKKRVQVWKVFEEFINLMRANNKRDINLAIYECSQLSEKVSKFPIYQSVIVDEGQDFGMNEYKLLRKIAGQERPNDLFIVGDAHQRVYDKKTILSKCGINLAGRTSYLRVNYRTTDEIRKASLHILADIEIDDLNAGLDPKKACLSLTHGQEPIIKLFESQAQEADFIISEIRKLGQGTNDLKNICLVARTNSLVDFYRSQLKQAGLPVYDLKLERFDDQSQDGLRLATLHRVKGLEFRVIFIAALNHNLLPHAAAISQGDEVLKKDGLIAEKCLLYVAMTRAQKTLYLTSYGQASEFLTALI